MIKITDIEALFNLKNYKAEITISDVPKDDIQELSRYYGSKVDENSFFDSTSFKRNDVEITLKSSPKIIYGF